VVAPEHQGQAESITTDEIERAYDIAVMHAGHISNIIMGLVRMWRKCWLGCAGSDW
tara:strand:+ start:185 stop:352 length:168 start_codon:yes stop_codon:yes gene_type:complete